MFYSETVQKLSSTEMAQYVGLPVNAPYSEVDQAFLDIAAYEMHLPLGSDRFVISKGIRRFLRQLGKDMQTEGGIGMKLLGGMMRLETRLPWTSASFDVSYNDGSKLGINIDLNRRLKKDRRAVDVTLTRRR